MSNNPQIKDEFYSYIGRQSLSKEKIITDPKESKLIGYNPISKQILWEQPTNSLQWHFEPEVGVYFIPEVNYETHQTKVVNAEDVRKVLRIVEVPTDEEMLEQYQLADSRASEFYYYQKEMQRAASGMSEEDWYDLKF